MAGTRVWHSRFERLVAALAGGSAQEDVAPLFDRIVIHAGELGWTAMLDRLAAHEPPEGSPDLAKELVGVARALVDGALDVNAAFARVSALGLSDLDRAALCLYANRAPSIVASAHHIVILRLAAETAADPELAARISSTLGRAAANDPAWAARAFDYGLQRIADLPLPELQARLYLDLARCLSRSGAIDDAMTCARMASVLAARAEDQVTGDAATVLHAFLLMEEGQVEEAATTISPVVVRQRSDGVPPGVPDAAAVLDACIDGAMSRLFERITDLAPEEAIREFERSLALVGESGHVYLRQTDQRSKLAQLLAARGAVSEAVRQMVQVLHDLERAGPADRIDEVVDWLSVAGGQLLGLGDFATALDALSDVARLAAARPHQDDRSANLRLLYASALQAMGQNREASALVTGILADCKAHGLTAAEMNVHYVLGSLALAERRLDEARTRFEDSAALAEGAGNNVHLGSSLCRLGIIDALLRQAPRAAKHFDRALTLHRESEYWPGVVVTLIQATQTYVELGDLQHARACADELKALGDRYPPHDAEWIPFAIARVAAAEGDWTRARDLFKSALDGAEALRRGHASADARRNWTEPRTELYGHAIQAAIAAGASIDAIEFLERGRNRYLRDLTGLDADRPPIWPQLSKAIPIGYSAVWFGGFPHGLGIVAATRQPDGEFACVSRLDRSPTAEDLTRVFRGDMAAVLDTHDGEGLVDFIARLVRDGKEPSFGPDARWQQKSETWARSLESACAFLRERVWPAIVQTAPIAAPNLLLLPSVGCSEMPYAAAAPDWAAAGVPLSICGAPSLAVLADTDSAPPLDPRTSFLVTQIVNPSEDSALPGCSVEARHVARAVAGKVVSLRGRRAIRPRVLEALASSDVVHFMGHAFVDWHDPMQSGLVCAAERGEAGTLTVGDVVREIGRIRARLIVLSACEVGYVRAGDRQNDFVGLPAALIAVGARTVVAPRWAVDDLPTSMFMSTLLRAWLQNAQELPRALADTRRWLRDDVTMDAVTAWIESAVEDPAVDRDALRATEAAYAREFAPADHPFSHARHWGAFEIIGCPIP